MAKQVQPLEIILGIKGAEKLAALKSSFRDLTKTVKQSDADIESARKSINDYVKSANNSEAVIKGQIKAFEGLREQAAMGGKVYRELSDDITELRAQLTGSTSAIDAQRKSILELASGAEVTAKQLQAAVDQLFALRNETKLDSVAFNALGKDIDGLTARISGLAEQAKRTASENKAAVASVNATLAKYEASAKSQAANAARREQIVRDEVLALSEKKKVTDELIQKENQLTAAIKRRRQLSVQEGAREARRRVRAGAQVYTGKGELGPIDALDERLGGLPNTTAAFSQRLSELQDRLVNTVRGGNQYIQVALRIAQVQREASAATQGLGAALVNDLVSGVAVRNQRNLREAIGQLQVEMSELNTETAEGSAKYAENARQVNKLQKELDGIANSYRTVADVARQAGMAMGGSLNPFTVAGGRRRATPDFAAYEQPIGPEISPAAKQAAEDRKQEIRDRIANLKRINAENDALREQNAIRRSIAKNREKVAARAGIDRPMREISGLYKGIADIGMSKIAADIDRMGNSYYQVANDIKNATKASNGSINSLQAQRNAWASLRAGLDPTSKAYQDVGREIEKVDRRLEKLNRSRRRMSPMQMTQAAGAAISGGIFGGPEGFLGGAIGAIGGVGSAFAGAAIGAQVGGLRRTLGEYADYAAQIARLQIALEGISGSQDQYNRALAAAADVTKSLNVPQEVAIQGMTRLVAAVKGAGGGVADAEIAFKNINSAIIATGGGAEQVQGAVTALVQIFSKGKVSAEEINQIAERLPGTFNKIAAASGRTGPELTKALQDGKVGLNDLMKFLVSLGDEYGALALKIAASSENAGARLQIAFNNMRIEVGNALQPIGAEFQDAFAEFIKDITPTLVAVLPKIGEAVLILAKNLDVLTVSAAAAFAVLGAGKIAALGGISAALLKLAAAAGTASVALKGTAAAALLNPWVALAAGVAAATAGIIKYYQNQKQLNEILDEGTASTDVLKEKIREYESSIQDARNKLNGVAGEQKATRREAQRLKQKIGELVAELNRLKGTYTVRIKLEQQGYTFDSSGNAATYTVAGVTYDAKTGRPVGGTDVSEFEAPKPDDSSASKKAARDADRVAQQIAQIKLQEDAIERSKALLEINTEIRENARQIIFAQTENNMQKAYALRQDGVSLEFLKKDLEIQLEYQKSVEAATLEENAQIRVAKRQLAEKQRIFGIEENINNAMNDRIGLVQENTIELKKQAKALEDARFGLREQLGLVSPKETVTRAQEQFKAQYPGATEADLDLIRQQIDPTPFEKMRQNITQLREELAALVDPVNQITNAANAIGDAFAQSFVDAISGAKTAKEALADFFQSVGSYFLDMAKQIIAKMIQIAILNSVAKLLPGLGSSGSTGFNLNGMGQAFAPGGSMPFPMLANGGPVTGGSPYIVGERGPELFIPFQSGRVASNDETAEMLSPPFQRNGSSNVSNSFQQLQAVNLPFTRTSERIETERRERETLAAIRDPGPIDVRYESQVINGVEYVTADQHRKGMTEAAERGRALALSSLQNSVKARKQAGIL